MIPHYHYDVFIFDNHAQPNRDNIIFTRYAMPNRFSFVAPRELLLNRVVVAFEPRQPEFVFSALLFDVRVIRLILCL